MQRKKQPKRAVVFDNNGDTLDRYTIVLPDGDVCGCNSEPFRGIGGFSHNVVDMAKVYDRDWRSTSKATKYAAREVRQYLHESRTEKNLGKEVYDHATLPEDVHKYIVQLMTDVDKKFL